MRAMWIVGAVLIACGTTSVPDGTLDAPSRGGAGSGSGSNSGGSGGGTNIVDDVTCQTHTHTSTGSDGTRQVDDTRFAIVDSVAPGDNFVIELCDGVETITQGSNTTIVALSKPNIPACATGSTCAESGATYPAVAHGCSWNSGGTFWDGKLAITCGSTSTVYTAQGAVNFKFDVSYGSIKIHH